MRECPKSELRSASELRWVFMHEPDTGVTLDDVCQPGYWKHVWRQLATSKHVKIEVIAKDQSWEAELRVFAVGDGFVKVRVLNEWHAAKSPGRKPSLPDEFKSDFVENSGWRVRNPQGEIVTSGHVTESDAITATKRLADKVAA